MWVSGKLSLSWVNLLYLQKGKGGDSGLTAESESKRGGKETFAFSFFYTSESLKKVFKHQVKLHFVKFIVLSLI